MNKGSVLSRNHKAYYLIMISVLVVLFGITLAQNAIRYGVHESYSIWRSVLYLSISLLLFSALLPLIIGIGEGIQRKKPEQFWLWSVLLIPVYLAAYYLITGPLEILVGFTQEGGMRQYARQYFGKDALFHLIILIASNLYLYLSHDQTPSKLITGSVGRKTLTLPAARVSWIEADDHYLRIHSDQATMMKRSSLENMYKELAPDFIRIHRKYLVNTAHIAGKIKQQRDEYVLLKSGDRLKVGRSFSPIEIH